MHESSIALISHKLQITNQPDSVHCFVIGVSVVNNAPTAVNPEDQAHSNFTILFRNGAGVQVVEKKGLLHLMVVLPPINEVMSFPPHISYQTHFQIHYYVYFISEAK